MKAAITKSINPSVEEFAEDFQESLAKLRANDMPMVLSVDGEPAVVVCDLRLAEFLARGAHRDLQEVLELRIRKMDSGEDEGIPAEQVFRELRAELKAKTAAKSGKRK